MSEMSAAAINDLPDSAFAYIEPGGHKDDEGKTVPRSLRHFPIHDAAHVRNALARAPQSPFGDKAMPKIRAAAKKFGIDVSSDSSRSQVEEQPVQIPLTYRRTYELEGIEILSRAKGGDGRTVEAYAAVFDTPTEIHDQHGDYVEVIDSKAFNREIGNGVVKRAQVLLNHGYDVQGKTGGLQQAPLGSPIEIRAESRGLLTISRYNDGPLTEQVLAGIRNGDYKAQSFEGPIRRSDPSRAPGRSHTGNLPTVRRLELGLRNYGPTMTPYYPQAEITAVRSAAQLAEDFARLDEAAREELIQTMLADPELARMIAAPSQGLGAEDSHQRSIRLQKIRLGAELRARSLTNATQAQRGAR